MTGTALLEWDWIIGLAFLYDHENSKNSYLFRIGNDMTQKDVAELLCNNSDGLIV